MRRFITRNKPRLIIKIMSFLKLFGNKVRAKDVQFQNGNILESTTKIYMISGTTVKNLSNQNSCLVNSYSEIVNLFKATYNIDVTNQHLIGVIFTNGDGGSNSIHIDGKTWLDTDLYVTFNTTTSGNIRINYTYFYRS